MSESDVLKAIGGVSSKLDEIVKSLNGKADKTDINQLKEAMIEGFKTIENGFKLLCKCFPSDQEVVDLEKHSQMSKSYEQLKMFAEEGFVEKIFSSYV